MAYPKTEGKNLYDSTTVYSGHLYTSSHPKGYTPLDNSGNFAQLSPILVHSGDIVYAYNTDVNSTATSGGAFWFSFAFSDNISTPSRIISSINGKNVDWATMSSVSNEAYIEITIPEEYNGRYLSFAAKSSMLSRGIYIGRIDNPDAPSPYKTHIPRVDGKNLLDSSGCVSGSIYNNATRADDGRPVVVISSQTNSMSNPILVHSGDVVYAYNIFSLMNLYLAFSETSDISDASKIYAAFKYPYADWIYADDTESGIVYTEVTVPEQYDGMYLSFGLYGTQTTSQYTYIAISEIDYITDIVLQGNRYHIRDAETQSMVDDALEEVNQALEGLQFRGKVVNCLGDSITQGYIGPSNSDWQNPMWVDTIALNLGCITHNYGVGGTGICGGRSGDSFEVRLTNMSETKIDVLLIWGGTNDYGDSLATTLGTINDPPASGTNFYAALKHLVETAINKYPSAKIAIITPMRRRYGSKNSYNISMEDIATAEVNVANLYGLPVLDFYHCGNINPGISIHNSTYTADGLHPNQLGVNLFIAPLFTEFVRHLLQYRPSV